MITGQIWYWFINCGLLEWLIGLGVTRTLNRFVVRLLRLLHTPLRIAIGEEIADFTDIEEYITITK